MLDLDVPRVAHLGRRAAVCIDAGVYFHHLDSSLSDDIVTYDQTLSQGF